MPKDWVMSQETLEALLDWLGSDREQAATRYEEIRTKLIKYFSPTSQSDAEALADETINRVARRLNEIKDQVYGERVRYFYGVARKVQMEYLRRKQPRPGPEPISDPDLVETEYRCLEECVAKLSAENRELVMRYYDAEGRERIDQRKLLAEELGIAPNALRIRAYRIRAELQKCLKECVDRSRR
jgi:DNA-directed RNA polymerase specialized sigma24 family protein